MPIPRFTRPREVFKRQVRRRRLSPARLLEVERLENRTSLSVDGGAAALLAPPAGAWKFDPTMLGSAPPTPGSYVFLARDASGGKGAAGAFAPDLIYFMGHRPLDDPARVAKLEGFAPDPPSEMGVIAKIDHFRALVSTDESMLSSYDESGGPPLPFLVSASGGQVPPMMAEFARWSVRLPERIATFTENAISRLDEDPLVPLTQQSFEPSSPGPLVVTMPDLEGQQPSILEATGSGSISFVATGVGDNGLLQLPAFRVNDEPAPIEITPSLEPAVAVESFWGNLVNGADLPLEPGPAVLEQTTELVPLPGSALDLIAVLGTVPADSQGASFSAAAGADDAIASNEHPGSSSSWANFVMGLDEGFDQQRIASDDEQADPAAPSLTAEAASAVEGSFTWYQPAVVVSEQGPGLSSAIGPATVAASHVSPPGLGSAQIGCAPASRGAMVKLRVMPAWAISFLSVSASAWLVGRTWTRRKQRGAIRPDGSFRRGVGSFVFSWWSAESHRS